QALDPNGHAKARRISFDITHDSSIENWNLQTTVAYFDSSQKTELTIFPPNADFTNLGGGSFPDGVIGRPDIYERHLRTNFSAYYSGLNNHKLRMGLGYHFGDMYRIAEEKNFFSNPIGIPVPLGSVVDVTNT